MTSHSLAVQFTQS